MSSTSSVPKYQHKGHSILYVAMTSTLYTVLCLAAIAILLVILAVLLYYYCFRVRRKYSYSQKTVRYSPISQSDQSEEEKSVKRKKSKRVLGTSFTGTGLGHDASPSYSASTKWPAVPVSPLLDTRAGHVLLQYIETNLQNQNRLQKEWEALQDLAPDASTMVASLPENKGKNRYNDAVPFDHSRVRLGGGAAGPKASDYINASLIVDRDKQGMMSRYIATQGPLQETVGDFWQMVWEQNVVVIVMLTTLYDMGLSQSSQYWPSSGVTSYRNYEVRLVSEHPHSEDYIIRSLCLQNTKTRESRTITHFQYLTWTSVSSPARATPLLEFRRKVNKAYEPWHHTPLLVHCSGGVGRTGTYILIDLTLSRIRKGAKELDLAATVEHLRDNRPCMVRTKAQFEFAFSAIVEEMHNMLNAASQQQRH